VIAHILHNLSVLFAIWLTDTYSAYGIWDYYMLLSMLLLLFFAYMTLRQLETMLERDNVPRFENPERRQTLTLFLNPGWAVFALAFAAKAIFDLF
jgi:hypothetical protein